MEITTVFLNKKANHYKIYKISTLELYREISRLAKANFILTSVDGMAAFEFERQYPELFLTNAA